MNQTIRSSRPNLTSKIFPDCLALAAVIVIGLCFAPLSRRVEFWRSGVVSAEGIKFHLDPHDEVITQAILRDGTWEKPETDTIRRLLRSGDTFIDVGANIGWYTAVASKAVGDRGRVIAFEPAPDSFGFLRRTVKANGFRNVALEQKALSDKPGRLTLHIGAANKGHNSIIGSSATQGSVDVEAITLDDYLNSVPGEIALIKIDTEGAEGFILAGMSETFRRNPRMALLMEFHPALLRAAGFDPAAVIRRLYQLGYHLEAVEPGTGRGLPVTEDKLPTLTTALEASNSYVNLLATK